MSMNDDERRLIEGLFTRLRSVERDASPRDAEAEGFIRQQLSAQPAAPYYMAQTIIVQEQALEAAQARIQALEEQSRQAGQSGGGGLLGSLFGGGQRPAGQGSGREGAAMPAGSPWGGRGAQGGQPQAQPAAPRQGGGFLAGAAQTAVGVAGGMMLGSMLGSMFGGAGEALAGEAGEAVDGVAEDAGFDGFDDGGDLGGFDDI
ncbi:DUF2076 domain-containing protein [Aureimonas frigidaquae]|uniref:DUF2076 domain-containing protein n=1 Tax=Aureimonas frigidaquae TaxID=424757 RepID=UPI000A9C76F5|nr:DUF2076 domain-containing protein [Aureimonas frigidaquae]